MELFTIRRSATTSALVAMVTVAAGTQEYDFRNIGKKSLNVMSGHTHEALADH